MPFVFLNFPFFLLLPSLRRGKRKAFPVSNMWSGYKTEELLEAAHGDSHRVKKSSVPAVSLPVCSQGQSQIPHEGKPVVGGPPGEAGAATALARSPEAVRQVRGHWWTPRVATRKITGWNAAQVTHLEKGLPVKGLAFRSQPRAQRQREASVFE